MYIYICILYIHILLTLYYIIYIIYIYFLENYQMLYFDARHVVVKLLVHFFFKKVPFLANIGCCPNFLE